MARRKSTSRKAAAKKAARKSGSKKASRKAAAKKAARKAAPKAKPKPKQGKPASHAGWQSQFIVGFFPALFQDRERPFVDVIDKALAPLFNDFPGKRDHWHVCDHLPNDIPPMGFAVVHFDDPNTSLAQLLSKSYDGVRYIERQAVIALSAPATTTATTNFGGVVSEDPYAEFQWALARIGAPAVWKVPAPAGNTKTIVAIVDSGLQRLDGSYPEDINAQGIVLPPNTWPFDGVDRYGHGTMLAGTIAAVTDNQVGVASPVPDPATNDWGIRLMPIRFFGPLDPPLVTSAAMAICVAVKTPGVKVINASWHVNVARSDSQCLLDAIRAANKANILFVAAAGNDGSDNRVYPTYPANYGNMGYDKNLQVLTVAASAKDDSKAWFSNYSASFVDIAAPGMHIPTTGNYFADPPRYPWYNGTSPAAALCSSAAALVYACNPAWRPDTVQQYLKDSADKVPLLRRVCQSGNRLNIANAILPVVVTAPTGGEYIQAGQNYFVTWKRKFASKILDNSTLTFAYEKSNDGGASWQSRALPGKVSIDDKNFLWPVLAADRAALGRLRITMAGAFFTVTSDVFEVV
jgi:Subtilase family